MTYPGLRWIFCREYGTELLDSVIPQFLEMFPEHLSEYRYFKQPKEARFSNGSTIFFRAFDSVGVRKILSSSYDGGCICQAEQTSKSLVLELIGRFRSMALPRKILLVEGNPDPACWPKKRYISGSLPKGCVYFEAPTQVNEENLIDNYVDRMKENYPKEWIDRKIYGKWDSKSGVIYSEFDLDFHVINRFEIKDWWFKAVGVDHGYVNPSCFLWGAVDDKKNIYIYDEFYKSHQQTHELITAAQRYGPLPMPADTSMKKKERDYGNLWDDLVAGGLNLVEVPKDKMANILGVNKLFHQRRLFIFHNCKKLIGEMEDYIWKPHKLNDDKSPTEEVRKIHDHACDALQYLIRYLNDIKVLTPVEKNYLNTFDYQVKHVYPKDDEGFDDIGSEVL